MVNLFSDIAVMTPILPYQVTTVSCGVFYDFFDMIAQLKMAITHESENNPWDLFTYRDPIFL
jgi:hypothetical protein